MFPIAPAVAAVSLTLFSIPDPAHDLYAWRERGGEYVHRSIRPYKELLGATNGSLGLVGSLFSDLGYCPRCAACRKKTARKPVAQNMTGNPHCWIV